MRSVRLQLLLLVLAGVVATVGLTAALKLGYWMADQKALRVFDAKDVTADILPPPMYLIELRLMLALAADGDIPPDQARSEAARLTKEYGDRVTWWRDHPPHGLESDLLGAQHQAAQRMLDAVPPVLKAIEAKDAEGLRAAMTALHAHYAEHRAGVDKTVQRATAFATASMADREQTQQWLLWTTVGGLALVVVLLSTLGAWVARNVMRASGGEPADVSAVASAVAEGNLTVEVPLQPGDTTSTMAAMQRMCRELSRLVAQVRGASQVIATSAEQIVSGNTDLNARTEQQTGSLQQTASAMEQLSGTVQHTAEAASQAAELSNRASETAERGSQVVQNVVQTMDAITQSSRQIADITGVIDGIAFQTNILALNAAVEAARAGEQGRGFAVVAAEVRSLAQRSAAAARQISELITSSVQRVESGAHQVEQAGRTMNEIVEQVQRVAGLISEISNATREQTSGIALVSQAVAQLDTNTQGNASLVRDSAAAADGLKRQARELIDTVDTFRIGAVA